MARRMSIKNYNNDIWDQTPDIPACSAVPQATAAIHINLLAPSDPYMGRTEPLTSRRCILNTYSTNIRTEYFKHAA
jgi:phage portal protein BeeE